MACGSIEAPPRSSQVLKDWLLMSCCHIPWNTFRGLVESMPRQVKDVSAAKGGPAQYQAAGNNAMANRHICDLVTLSLRLS